jgi:hypothetical protein
MRSRWSCAECLQLAEDGPARGQVFLIVFQDIVHELLARRFIVGLRRLDIGRHRPRTASLATPWDRSAR